MGREQWSREHSDHSGIASISSLSFAIMSFISARLGLTPFPLPVGKLVGAGVRVPRVTSRAFNAFWSAPGSACRYFSVVLMLA
jgi:hypothetical protein